MPPASLPVQGNRMGACRPHTDVSACQSISCPAALRTLTASAPWVSAVKVKNSLWMVACIGQNSFLILHTAAKQILEPHHLHRRSEERRVGKERGAEGRGQ